MFGYHGNKNLHNFYENFRENQQFSAVHPEIIHFYFVLSVCMDSITTLSGGFLVTNWLAREQQMLSDVSYSFFLPILFKTHVISFGGRH